MAQHLRVHSDLAEGPEFSSQHSHQGLTTACNSRNIGLWHLLLSPWAPALHAHLPLTPIYPPNQKKKTF